METQGREVWGNDKCIYQRVCSYVNVSIASMLPFLDNSTKFFRDHSKQKLGAGYLAFLFLSAFSSLRKSVLREDFATSSLENRIPFILGSHLLAVGWLGEKRVLVWIYWSSLLPEKKQSYATSCMVFKLWQYNCKFGRSRDLPSSLCFHHSLVWGYWTEI